MYYTHLVGYGIALIAHYTSLLRIKWKLKNTRYLWFILLNIYFTSGETTDDSKIKLNAI